MRRLTAAVAAVLIVAALWYAMAPPRESIAQSAGSGFDYPIGAIPFHVSATGTTGAVAATQPATANRVNYLCGFMMTDGGATAAAVGTLTITGLVGGTFSQAFVSPSSGQGLVGADFKKCLPATGPNIAIVGTKPAAGAGAIAAATSIWGYQASN